jgi:hypothetical protein
VADQELTTRITTVESMTAKVQAAENFLADLKARLRAAIEEEKRRVKAEATERAAAIRSAQAALVKPRKRKSTVEATEVKQ